MHQYSFSKSERLKSSKIISRLFEDGKSFYVFPVRVVYLQNPECEEKLQIAISVPKKSFKKAVDRNLLKRRIREAYRLNKGILKDNIPVDSTSYAVMFIYTAKEIVESSKIHKSMIKVLNQLETNLYN